MSCLAKDGLLSGWYQVIRGGSSGGLPLRGGSKVASFDVPETLGATERHTGHQSRGGFGSSTGGWGSTRGSPPSSPGAAAFIQRARNRLKAAEQKELDAVQVRLTSQQSVVLFQFALMATLIDQGGTFAGSSNCYLGLKISPWSHCPSSGVRSVGARCGLRSEHVQEASHPGPHHADASGEGKAIHDDLPSAVAASPRALAAVRGEVHGIRAVPMNDSSEDDGENG